jgi:hypothetical protein
VRTTCRMHEYLEGWIGRRRTYKCRKCQAKFQVDTLNPLPIAKRICPICKAVPAALVDCHSVKEIGAAVEG